MKKQIILFKSTKDCLKKGRFSSLKFPTDLNNFDEKLI